MSTMPTIHTEKLSEAARTYADLICVKGVLRASKPPVKKIKVPSEKYGYTYESDNPLMGRAAYVWRMVAFQCSPNPKHHCMPCTADFDFSRDDFSNRRESVLPYLDAIVKEIVDAIPPREWHGVIRWGQAFGQIGTPRYTDDGAVIYR